MPFADNGKVKRVSETVLYFNSRLIFFFFCEEQSLPVHVPNGRLSSACGAASGPYCALSVYTKDDHMFRLACML